MSGRGERTRVRLLEEATRLFSERGFEGVSTRDIASAAETTLPSIAHHFGSKEGLYNAVLASIAVELATTLLPACKEAEEILAQNDITKAQALETLQRLLSAHVRAMLSGSPDWAALIVREQLHPSPAMAPIVELFEKHMIVPLTRLISILRGLPPDSEPIKLQALSLLGRVITFRTIRSSALHFLGWTELTQSEIDTIISALNEETQAIFRQ